MGVDADKLAEMLPSEGIEMKHEPIRLCGACYAEKPYHCLNWQYKTTNFCIHHGLALLSECPSCGARFKVPAQWIEGNCQRCFMTFADMRNYQKLVKC
jgi:hypothetical protein